MRLEPDQRRQLLSIARASINSALPDGVLAPCPREQLPADLMERRSSFVTLRIDHELRGCCGTLDAPRPLAQDVWRNAWASAFNDPRFTGLTVAEWPRVDLHLSVLGLPQPFLVANEEELLQQLQPGVDGLIFELGAARATFLPSVWEQIGDPLRFVQQLKLKAGLPADFWSRELRIFRYGTESFGEHETG
jgi:uncharacterized protein